MLASSAARARPKSVDFDFLLGPLLQQDVAGLNVPMNESLSVCSARDRWPSAVPDAQYLRDVERAAAIQLSAVGFDPRCTPSRDTAEAALLHAVEPARCFRV